MHENCFAIELTSKNNLIHMYRDIPTFFVFAIQGFSIRSSVSLRKPSWLAKMLFLIIAWTVIKRINQLILMHMFLKV